MWPRIRTATLTGLAEVCRSVGLDPAELVATVGLTVADLEPSDRWVPGPPVARLLELAAQRSGLEDFALRMSAHRGLGTLGPLSVALRDMPDLGSALDLAVRHDRVYNEALHLRLTEGDVLVTVEAWLEFGEPLPTAQSLDLVMAVLLGVIRTLVGGDWEPRSAWFARPAPVDAAPFARMFGRGVRFDCETTAVVFPARDLRLPVVTSDASIRPYTQAYLGSVVGSSALTVAAQAADALEVLLPLGRGSAEQVARRIGLSPRQLQRSLAEEGESFTAVVHTVRGRLAERYLATGGHTLTELSQRLGFAAPSAFSRWFRQQFGTSPSDWRGAARAAPPPAVPAARDEQPGGEGTSAP